MTIVKAVTESRGPFSQSRFPPSSFVSAARAGARAHHAGSRFDLLVPDQLLNGLKKKKSGILIVTFSMLQNTLCGNYRVGKNYMPFFVQSACS